MAPGENEFITPAFERFLNDKNLLDALRSYKLSFVCFSAEGPSTLMTHFNWKPGSLTVVLLTFSAADTLPNKSTEKFSKNHTLFLALTHTRVCHIYLDTKAD